MRKPNILDYHTLKGEIKLNNAEYNAELKSIKKSLHKQYVEANKWQFRILDIALVFVILFNLGAIFITDLLVVKGDPETVFVEANQFQCDLQGYACASPEQGRMVINSLLRQSIIWAGLIFCYIYFRSKIFTDGGYYLLLLGVLYYLCVTGFDFISNLGSYIGKVLYGG